MVVKPADYLLFTTITCAFTFNPGDRAQPRRQKVNPASRLRSDHTARNLIGELTSILGMLCTNRFTGQYPNGHLLRRHAASHHSPRGFTYLSTAVPQTTDPRPRAVRGQQQGSNAPPFCGEDSYSSLPSKHTGQSTGAPLHAQCEMAGFAVLPILPKPGRTQPTPSASRSVGAEITGKAILKFVIRCSQKS